MAVRRSAARSKKHGGAFGVIVATLRFAFILACVVGALSIGYLGASIWRQLKELPDITIVERYEPIEAIQLFDRNDRLVCTIEGDEDRRVVPLNQISTQTQQAMLAAEDHHFYEHHGVNVMSIMRACIANLQAGHVVEGGSTITQQLVKNLFFTEAQRNIDRKIKEAFMAHEIESRYSKDRILEMYLNQIYFGNNAYGIERAASRYFDKNAAQLSLAQSAFLAGLVKAPSELGAQNNRAMAMSRRNEILDKMVEYGYITPSQATKAKAQKLVFKKGNNPLNKYPYYVSYVLELLRSRFSQSEIRKQGLRVYTNLDPQAQELAEKSLAEGIKKAPKGVSQGALVTELVQDGSVVALVGGVGNYWKNQFNRATNPHTAGSSFKPFVYLTALIKGVITPDSLVDDRPLIVKQRWGLPDYCPKNFDHRFMGRIMVRKALALSRNVPAVRVGQMSGMDSVVETARLAGITTKLDPNLSLCLGSSAVSPLDMASAYATFARAGVAIRPQVLRRIENNRGQVIEVFESKVDKAFPVEPVARLVDILQDVVKYGTGTQARLQDRPVAGKTGTADAGKDIWFIGFTPDMVTALWAGNDDNLPIPGTNVTGGVVMAKIWREYAKAYYGTHPTPPGVFIAPSGPSPGERNAEKEKLDGEVTAGVTGTDIEPQETNKTPVDIMQTGSTSGLGSEVATPHHGIEPGEVPSVTEPTFAPSPVLTPAPATGPSIAPAFTPAPTFAPAPTPSTNSPPVPAPAITPSPSTSPLPAPNPVLAPRGMFRPNDLVAPNSANYATSIVSNPPQPKNTTLRRKLYPVIDQRTKFLPAQSSHRLPVPPEIVRKDTGSFR